MNLTFLSKLKQMRSLWALLFALGLGLLLGYGLRNGGEEPGMDGAASAVTEVAGEAAAMVYVCPMMCVPPMEQPGNCPICGMELTATPVEASDSGAPRVRLSADAVRLAQIRTARVERKFVSAEVRLFGQIDYDPAHVTNITAFMPGVIDRVYVKRAGAFVRWGQPLFDIYSPDLLATMQQLIEVRKHVPSFFSFREGRAHIAKEAPVQGGELDPGKNPEKVDKALKMIEAVRHKLLLLGLPKRDIDELMKASEPTGIATVYSSMYGQVVEQNAFEGSYVNTGTTIFTVADPQYVWVRLDAYEVDYPWIRKGQDVTFQVDAYPGETFQGTVVYIDPVFDRGSRTFNIGAIVPDSGGRLKAGMLIRSVIHARLTAEGKIADSEEDLREAPLVIPASAPLVTGARAVVYVAQQEEEGLFEGREVMLGPRARDDYIVLGGLKEGETVVVNGSFKIDSSVQIQARGGMMAVPGGHSAIARLRGSGEKMHEDYMAERNRSRLSQTTEPETLEAETLEGEDKRTDPVGDYMGPSGMQRRKPGAYGDTSRPTPRGWGQ